MPRGLLLISTQTALIFWCHQDWKRWWALAGEVLKHAVVPGVMVVRVRDRVRVRVRVRMREVVVGEDGVGVRPLWVTPCHVVGLLLKEQQTRQLQDRKKHLYRSTMKAAYYGQHRDLFLGGTLQWI